MNIKKIYRKGAGSVVCGIAAAMMALPVLTSCEDFFTQESDDVLYADDDHLNVAEDTLYSVTGILSKLQALADRTILLGELRGDLVDLTNVASSDLREIANFNISDDNKYNSPSDYYAVINNCNYFIAHVDTAQRDTRNDQIFIIEYCVIKSIRAWTYLQLALNYGSIPFYTEPLLSKEQAEAAENGPRKEIEAVCDFFIDDLQELPDLMELYGREFPRYYSIGGIDAKLMLFPLSIVRGDLYLWRATFRYSHGDIAGSTSDYRQAALHYYKYISERNGSYSAYPTMTDRCYWKSGETSWLNSSGNIFPIDESTDADAELITLIAGDTRKADGNYSVLCDLFTSSSDNDYRVSIEPSARMIEISESQSNLVLATNGNSFTYAPPGLTDHQSGDLRFSSVWSEDYRIDRVTSERIKTQTIMKYDNSRNVRIYRRMMVYLRLAEALNGAGYPRMAFQILSEGLSNKTIQNNVISRYYDYDAAQDTTVVSVADSTFLAQFDFPNIRYEVGDKLDFASGIFSTNTYNHNQIGIHARGCGYTPMDTTYVLPHDTIETNPALRAQLIAEQQVAVDSLILNESALEFAFEGTRYYDIMRYALRQTDPEATMDKIIGMRRGKATTTATPLTTRSNWFLSWKGKIGY